MKFLHDLIRPRHAQSLLVTMLALAGVAGILLVTQLENLALAAIALICVVVFLILEQFRRTLVLMRANHSLSEKISAQEAALESMKDSRDELSRLVVHQDKIREDERKRIAAEIHDTLGQNLLALRLDATLLHARTGPESRLNRKAVYALHTIDMTIASVRDMIGNLRPPVLELGLSVAIAWQLKEFERINRIQCTLLTDEQEFNMKLDDGRTLLIFRTLQEALSNTARHAQATEIVVQLHQSDEQLSMTVRDNGKGFQFSDRRRMHAFGLMGIRESIESLGGKLVVESGNGTRLSITIPLPQERRAHS